MLVALDALLDTASVTQAAAKTGQSQPGMSRTLARLRTSFGDPLLVRSGSGLRRTARSEALRAPLKQLLEDASALYRLPRFDAATADREFRGAIPDVVAAVILPGLIARFATDAPGCRLTLAPWPARGAPLTNLDFAIATEPDVFPGFRMQHLHTDRDVLAVRASKKRRRLPLDEILARRHVAVVAAGFTEDLADLWLRDAGLVRTIAVTVPHYLQALHLVARTELLAILPARLIGALGPSLGVTGVELPIEQTADRQWLLVPPHLARDPALLWLSGLLREIAPAGGRVSRRGRFSR